MRQYLTLLLAVLLCGFSSGAQKISFLPGYYITHQGDTVHGFGYIEKKNTIRSFSFKPDPDSTAHSTIKALDCKEIVFGKEAFVTWYGKRHLAYVDGNDISRVVHMGDTVTDSVCIKMIYQGKDFALYQYKGEKNHFFMKTGNYIEELVLSYDYFPRGYRLATSNYQKAAYLVHKTYQQQIFAALAGRFRSQKQVDLLYSTEYERYHLVKLFKALDK